MTYLSEIMLTYRLLFIISDLSSTQTYYRCTHGMESPMLSFKCRDTFLNVSCGMKHESKDDKQGVYIDYSGSAPSPRTSDSGKIWTTADFPHFRKRLKSLQGIADASKTVRFVDLWSHEHGSWSWFAFW